MIVLRYFMSQARKLLGNLKSGAPIAPALSRHKHISIGLKHPPTELDEYLEIKAEFEALGWVVSWFFRLQDGARFPSWWGRDRWDERADWAALMLRTNAPRGDFDSEQFSSQGDKYKNSYAADLHAAGSSREAMIRAMRPFVAVLHGARIPLGMYPANLDDVITEVFAGVPRVELMPQIGYPLASRYRKSRADARELETRLSRWTTQARRQWGEHVAVRHMSYEDILCRWGAPALADLAMYGTLEPHVYVADRVDEPQVGLATWADGLHQGAYMLKHLPGSTIVFDGGTVTVATPGGRNCFVVQRDGSDWLGGTVGGVIETDTNSELDRPVNIGAEANAGWAMDGYVRGLRAYNTAVPQSEWAAICSAMGL